ncbi:MAG: NnrU family protein [Jhaorihella sp.]
MTGWLEFIAALAVFMLSHMIPVRPPARPWLIARLGVRGYFIGYSILSVAVLAWLIVAAARAPFVAVIPYHPVLIWVPLLAMPLACWLGVAGLAAVNPLSFGGLGRGEFDADRPGVLGLTRHPLLLAMAVWAFAHMLANGDLAHVILFGLFVGFAAAGMALIDLRRRRELGAEAWAALARNTARLSLRGLRHVRLSPPVLLAAAVVYALLLWLHPFVIGVSPLP